MGRIALRAFSWLVPAGRRAEWLEEWQAELEALEGFRRSGISRGYPGVARFVAGALPHAAWIRMEGWTMDSVAQDLRYAVRVLRRSPAFTAVAALTLALGIGVNGMIFSLVNGLLFRPPAGVLEPERLVQIARSYDSAPRWDNWSWPALRLIGEEAEAFSDVAGYATDQVVLGRGESTEPAAACYVTGSYFETLGARPALGRLIGPQDESAPGTSPVVVLSHGLWLRRFGGDAAVVGSTLEIGSVAHEIVGVAAEGFAGVDVLGTPPDVWLSALQRVIASGTVPSDAWGSSWIEGFGRLREGTSFLEAEASLDAISMRLREASDMNEDMRVLLAPGVGLSPQERARGRTVSLLLSAIAGLVLLLTCANAAGLLLGRAAGRAAEVGVRQALGAGRARLTRQLLTESLVLALAGTLLAVPLVGWAGRAIPAVFPFPLAGSVGADVRVYLFLVGVGLAAGLLFGTAPAWISARRDVARTLREGGTTGGRRHTRVRDALVVCQLAISLALVSGSLLLGRSLLNARDAQPGFDPDGLLVGFVNLGATGRYTREQGPDFEDRLLPRLEALPGVAGATLASQAPVLGGHSRSTVQPAERPDDPRAGFEAEFTSVTPGYFEALGIRLLRGRTFRAAPDEPDPVVVVNDALASLFWPGQDPVGREIVRGEQRYRVVGEVAGVQMRTLRERPRPAVYYLHRQAPQTNVVIHLRLRSPGAVTPSALRGAVAAVDPDVPVTGITDLRAGLARSMGETRTFGILVAAFAGLAVALSVIGLYGLISQGVAQRSRELGIRIALGAGGGSLMRLVMGRAFALAAAGTALGIGVSVALGTALRGLLYGVSPASPWALGGAAALLLGAALAAAWLPARRAARVDAMVSLRD